MAASEGAATLVLKSHTERLKEEQKRENQKKKEQELAMQGSSKTEFSSGVKMGFAAGMPSAPVHQMKVIIICTHFNCLLSHLESPQWSCYGRSVHLLSSVDSIHTFVSQLK